MSGLEAAAITLSTTIVKSAVKLWLGDRSIASDASADAIDILSARVTSLVDQRQLRGAFDRMINKVTDISPLRGSRRSSGPGYLRY